LAGIFGQQWLKTPVDAGVFGKYSSVRYIVVAALGESPMAYLTKGRMNVAWRLLDESRQGVAEVAADMGYENPAAFSRAFKRHLGISPAVWRAR